MRPCDFIVGAYELDPRTGRRKKSKVVYSAPKGCAKSETAGLLGVTESLGPVRCDGFDADGQPVGRPVRSPFVRALATEEKQSGNTFQNMAFVMGEARTTTPRSSAVSRVSATTGRRQTSTCRVVASAARALPGAA